jgi:diguanylate cyclase (GGDEF)-like protein
MPMKYYIKKILSLGINDTMDLSDQARLNIINASAILAIVNTLLNIIAYFSFAGEHAYMMGAVSLICIGFIVATLVLNKYGYIKLAVNIMMIASMFCVFYISRFYLGPDYGFQRYFLIFGIVPTVFLSAKENITKTIYVISNLLIYGYIENWSYDYRLSMDTIYYSENIAHFFNYITIIVGFVVIIAMLRIYQYIISREEAGLKKALEEAEHKSKYDHLTNLMNRRYMMEVLEKRHNNSSKSGICCGVLMMDIDNFKGVNDEYGHPVGDKVLIDVSKTILNILDNRGKAARWGGEEFLVLLDSCEATVCSEIAEEIRSNVELLGTLGERKITISIGVACPSGKDDISEILKNADKNLYEAKARGKNRVVSS